jgi:hypothetical protein
MKSAIRMVYAAIQSEMWCQMLFLISKKTAAMNMLLKFKVTWSVSLMH